MTTPPALPADTGTRLAVERTWLAYERTMMAWVRTGTSLISFGFTIYKFFQLQVPNLAARKLIGPREFALIMIGVGLISLFLSTVQHRRSMTLFAQTYGKQPKSVAGIVAGIVSVMGLIAFAVVLFRG